MLEPGFIRGLLRSTIVGAQKRIKSSPEIEMTFRCWAVPGFPVRNLKKAGAILNRNVLLLTILNELLRLCAIVKPWFFCLECRTARHRPYYSDVSFRCSAVFDHLILVTVDTLVIGPPNPHPIVFERLDHTDPPVTAGRWHIMHRCRAAPAKRGWVRKAKCEAFIFSHRSGLHRVL